MKIQWMVFTLFLSSTAIAQNTYPINLNNVYVDPNVPFKVNRVVDGRKNKVTIGWVQPSGWLGKMKIAVLQGPLEREMHDILLRSSLLSSDVQGRVMRVTRFAIGEVRPKSNLLKAIRAEVAFDLFQMWGVDSCYYLGSAIGRSEQSATSASSLHADNLGLALEDAIQHLVLNTPPGAPALFSVVDLNREDFSFRDLGNVPILNTDYYSEGVFLSFDEFLENKPSVTSNYEVKNGSTVTLWRLEEGKKASVTDGVYAFAKDNELYILFNGKFYPLRRRNGSFQFLGPLQSDPSNFNTNSLVSGVGIAAVMARNKAKNPYYRIDMDTGGFVEMGIIR